MKYYLVSAIDTIDLGKVEILRQYNSKHVAMNSIVDVALELVKQNGGDRQMERALIKNMSMYQISKQSIHLYPLGYYIKKKDNVVEIYEKYVDAGWFINTYHIHTIKVISITEIELDDSMKLKCDIGTLYRSICNHQRPVPYMEELKMVLNQRRMKTNISSDVLQIYDESPTEENMYISNDED